LDFAKADVQMPDYQPSDLRKSALLVGLGGRPQLEIFALPLNAPEGGDSAASLVKDRQMTMLLFNIAAKMRQRPWALPKAMVTLT
jgi:hypothetical protein